LISPLAGMVGVPVPFILGYCSKNDFERKIPSRNINERNYAWSKELKPQPSKSLGFFVQEKWWFESGRIAGTRLYVQLTWGGQEPLGG
jgi:hypothetical protein